MHTHAGLKAATGSPEVTLTFSVGIWLDMEPRIYLFPVLVTPSWGLGGDGFTHSNSIVELYEQ